MQENPAAQPLPSTRPHGVSLDGISDLDAAVRAVHDAFELGTDEVEAVVYGGTGR